MFKCRWFLTILILGFLGLYGISSVAEAEGEYSLWISPIVSANPGEAGVCLYLVSSKPDSVAGFDVLVQFNPELLTVTSVEPTCRFQHFGYDLSLPGRAKITARRHVPDSVAISSLAPGVDTLGCILVRITSQDLLIDIETQVGFLENPGTPDVDNKLILPDSSFVYEPDLELTNGSVLIKHPLYGDLNDDGYPNTIADAIFFLNFLAGRQELTPRQKANSDVTRDGVQASMSDFINLVAIITEN
jgi:hypothetical protein